MPHTIHITEGNITGFNPSMPQPYPAGWIEVTPEQFNLAQSTPRPMLVGGEIVSGPEPEQELPAPSVLDQLHAAYTASLTAEQQVAFTPVYTDVRVLLEAGQPAMAAKYIRNTPVPPELVEIRESLAELVENWSE